MTIMKLAEDTYAVRVEDVLLMFDSEFLAAYHRSYQEPEGKLSRPPKSGIDRFATRPHSERVKARDTRQ